MKRITRVLTILAFAGWAGTTNAVPITDADIVTVNGTDWAQVDLFTNLSWNDINAYCPGGVCGTGRLTGNGMESWLWASTDDVNTLFNYYIGSNILGPGPDSHQEFPGSFGALFFADGWRATQVDDPVSPSRLTSGLMSDNSANVAYMGEWIGFTNIAVTNYSNSDLTGEGGWFYRDPNAGPAIPAPATLALFGIGLAGLGWSRRNKS